MVYIRYRNVILFSDCIYLTCSYDVLTFPSQKWNDDGDHHANAPYRSYDNIIDPVSGFVSAGGDVDRNTGHDRIRSLVQLNRTPQSAAPKTQNSIRASEPAAPPDLKRENAFVPGGPTAWNSRKTSDIWIRSQLGGTVIVVVVVVVILH